MFIVKTRININYSVPSRLIAVVTILCLTECALSQDEKNHLVVLEENATNNSTIIFNRDPKTRTISNNGLGEIAHAALKKPSFYVYILILGLVVIMSLVIPVVTIVRHNCKSNGNIMYAAMV